MTAQEALKTPVVLLIFNRPDLTARVLEAIRNARPSRLLVVCDGPRPQKAGEAEKVQQTRELIDRIDWQCEVHRCYSDVNLGCFRRVSSGLDWAFNLYEDAIVLEDDCLPHPTFFRFCEEMLERYRHDTRIGCVSGTNFQFGRRRGSDSYYFSRYNHCWGWASWNRAWRGFDARMQAWPEIRDGGYLKDLLGDEKAAKYWAAIFNAVSEDRIDSWAYRWTFTAWRENSLTILPQANLISNIGFTQDATHTRGVDIYANMAVEPLDFPLRHPPFMIRDEISDQFTQNTMFASPGLRQRLISRFRRLVR